ncbi:MAG: chemotaxis response regulator protein-glutamate methylesterase [Chloroflexi bacterium]|nr:chemotaxis response regulator protein-glutamate methylesterase [Chloroflexota bacterium]
MAAPVSPSAASTGGLAPIRVLVVDDSAFMRFTIAKHLAAASRLQVVATARDGGEALEMIPRCQPDVVTLDVEMPGLDGLSTLREIMRRFPMPVVMLSSLTTDGAVETVQALTWGAVDFVPKPTNKADIGLVMDEVIGKVLHAAHANVKNLAGPAALEIWPPSASTKTSRRLRPHDRVVVIGSSTGGPRALNTLIPALAPDLPAAFIIVQHMPTGFTHSLAERLDSISKIRVKEAQPGDRLEAGMALVAPGGFHLTVEQSGQVLLNQNPPVHGVRPAVDVTLASIVQHFGGSTIGVILTGMGNDGTNGAALIHSSGGKVIAEHESTCVVWGMPRSVVEAGLADFISPLHEIAAHLDEEVRTPTISSLRMG